MDAQRNKEKKLHRAHQKWTNTKNSKQETLIIIITAANVGTGLKANPSE